MKVGDLVELSAYGKKIKCLSDLAGDTGLLIGPNIVMWNSIPGFKFPVNRRDIKKVKSQ